MLYCDLNQLKTILEIPSCDSEEDARLLFYAEWASRWIEERINRPDISYKSRTDYYDTNGSNKIQLKYYPVYTTPTIQVFEDTSGYYGSPTGSFDATTSVLTYGIDFALKIDRPDGTSHCGLLLRINSLWPRRRVRQGGYLYPFYEKAYGAVKVVYNAGYTIDNCPPMIRLAANTLVAKMRGLFPIGAEIGSESYKDRSLTYLMDNRNYLMSHVEGMLANHKDFAW